MHAATVTHEPFFLPLPTLLSLARQQLKLKQFLRTNPAARLLNLPIGVPPSQPHSGPPSAVFFSDHKGSKKPPHCFVGEPSRPLADLRMYIQRIPVYFFSPQLFTVIWAAQDCKSRIILRWIKKNFHYHNPLD